MIFDSLLSLLNFESLFNVAWATLLGIVIGAFPGLTVTMGLALMTTMTYSFAHDQAILVLLAMYLGAIYGGSRSAILLNIPGTPANAATTLDGFPLARSGRASQALGIATTSSAIGSIIGVIFLVLFSPILAEIALQFRSFEYFWLGVFGILIAGYMTASEDPIKGWITGFIGLFTAMVGQESMHAYPRYCFGIHDLTGGIGLIPSMVGAFGFSEVISVMYREPAILVSRRVSRVLPSLSDLWRNKINIVRSGVLGTAIGIIPGVGEDIGSWISYAAARNSSKTPEEFGKGSLEGLIAAETGNNSAVSGAIIPALTLAVPGSAPAAVLLAAMFIHNVKPGPFIMIESPMFVYNVFWVLVLATLAMMFFGLVLTRPLLSILRISRERLMPIIFFLCVIGPYALSQRVFDIYIMFGFGILGFILREMSYPMAPLILGIILGDIIDLNLRRSLMIADGDFIKFIERPLSALFLILCIITLLAGLPFVRKIIPRLLKKNRCDNPTNS
jgi:putative tricarboxylic transport membrane protein